MESKAKYQSVEGIKIYKTRKYVQSEDTKKNAEARRLRDQYLKDHEEEINHFEDDDGYDLFVPIKLKNNS